MNEFLLGGISIASLVVALFFWRYWRSTRDRFFLFFSLSFLIEAVNRADMGLTHAWTESAPLHYLVRLVSYGLILVAIWDKNRPRP
ncbi:MAG: hypothetical protein EOP38_22885 [Rubrivivax sp.]|nr:MAG: hypothetical protein EOP38_22885 [Rubrivivax sp.]